MENISISKKQNVDEEIRRKNEQLLQEIERASSNNSKFIKFQDKEHKILRILPDMTESITVTYPSKPDEKVQRFKFMVFEQTKRQVEKNGNATTTEEEQLTDATDEPKEWTV